MKKKRKCLEAYIHRVREKNGPPKQESPADADEFHLPEFQSLGLGLYSYTQFEIWCLPIIKFLVQITST